MTPQILIIGTIKKILTHQREDGWGRFTLETDSNSRGTVVGRLPGVCLGTRVRIEGEREDKGFGPQITISRAEIIPIQGPALSAFVVPKSTAIVPVSTPSVNNGLIAGTVRTIRHSLPESGWHAITLKCAGTNDVIDCTVVFPGLTEGDQISQAVGRWDIGLWGKQFIINSCCVSGPKAGSDVLSFLAANVSGLGPKRQERIRLQFPGDELIAVLSGSQSSAIDALKSVTGISQGLAMAIVKEWLLSRDRWPIIEALQEAGLRETVAVRCYEWCNKKGENALNVLKTDPFLLSRHVDGVSFATAEEIWQTNGKPATATKNRTEQAAMNTLINSELIGHTCTTVDRVITATAAQHQIAPAAISAALTVLSSEKQVVVVPCPNGPGVTVWRRRAHQTEQIIAAKLKEISAAGPRVALLADQLMELVNYAVSALGIEVNGEKRAAIATAISQKITVISGPAGSGKSTTQAGVLAAAKRLGLRVALVAPTGMASQRLSEVCGNHAATTVYKLLGWNPGKNTFEFDAVNRLSSIDLVIADEASMLDAELFCALLSALDKGVQLVICGDDNQLRSVQHGAVLRDLILSGCIHHVPLTEIFRQGAGSGVVAAANSVLARRVPDAAPDFIVVDVPADQLVDRTLTRIQELRASGVNPGDIQVLTPMHWGPGGRVQLNAELQDLLNPKGVVVWEQGRSRGTDKGAYTEEFRIGDRIQQLHNNYELSIFNGDVGVIVDEAPESLLIKFGKNRSCTVYPLKFIRDELTLAYAITVHKSQGSEFPHVILVAPESGRMWNRSLVYTGITRARESCSVLQQAGVIQVAVTQSRDERWTTLYKQLSDLLPAVPKISIPVLGVPLMSQARGGRCLPSDSPSGIPL